MTQKAATLLEIKSLNVLFRTTKSPVNVITNTSFEIKESEVFGLVGESGCGKSLTALSIMGILPSNAYTEGTIDFRGQNLFSLDAESMRQLRGKEIAMIFQEPMTSLNPVLTIGYQISEVMTTHLGLSKKDSLDRSLNLLKYVKIPSPEIRLKEYPHQLSGGMRQRVMIAMAIACNPALLIADEPTTALDVTIQAQILALLNRLKDEKKMSILLITHDLGIIAENAERVAIMYAGRIVELADVRTLFSRPRHPYTLGLLDSLPKEKGKPLNPIPGSVPHYDNMPPGCKFADRCRFVIPECKVKEPELKLFENSNESHLVRCIRASEIN
ncbi:MAG: ABC transporter ATP-binding protein [Nitrospiraceae bacterium]|nr:ABC transporter ATP-binding protein [Nitrospiraceae bacterium]